MRVTAREGYSGSTAPCKVSISCSVEDGTEGLHMLTKCSTPELYTSSPAFFEPGGTMLKV